MELSRASISIQTLITVFFGIFVVLGGTLIGNGVSKLRERQPSAIGLVIRGAIIGSIVLLLASVLLTSLNSWSFAALCAAFLVALLGSAFVPQWFLNDIGAGTLIAIVLGAAAMAMGAAVVMEGYNRQGQNDAWFGFVWGGCALFVGFAFLSTGLGALLRGNKLAMKQMGPGEYLLAPEEELGSETHTSEAQKKQTRKAHKPKKRHH